MWLEMTLHLIDSWLLFHWPYDFPSFLWILKPLQAKNIKHQTTTHRKAKHTNSTSSSMKGLSSDHQFSSIFREHVSLGVNHRGTWRKLTSNQPSGLDKFRFFWPPWPSRLLAHKKKDTPSTFFHGFLVERCCSRWIWTEAFIQIKLWWVYFGASASVEGTRVDKSLLLE